MQDQSGVSVLVEETDPWDCVHDMKEAEMDVEEEIVDWYTSETAEIKTRITRNTVFDVMQHSAPTRKQKRNKKKAKKGRLENTVSYEPPAKTFYMEEAEDGQTDSSQTEHTSATESKRVKNEQYKPTTVPSIIKVVTESLEKANLNEQYPCIYKSLNVVPAKVLFDITDIVRKVLLQLNNVTPRVFRNLHVYLLLDQFVNVPDIGADKEDIYTSFR